LCARLELLLLHLGVHPFWIFFSTCTVAAPVPLTAVVTFSVSVAFAPTALYTSLYTLILIITTTPARFVALAVATAWGYIHLRVAFVLVAIAVAVAVEALKVLLAQTLASLDVCPTLTVLSGNATAIGVALVSVSVVFAVPCPPIILWEAVANIVSVCGSEACSLLCVARSLGWGAC
jgi:hypothetical protein